MTIDVIDAVQALQEKTKQAAPDEALKFSQAALNLAHAKSVLEAAQRENQAQER